jgi:hypothetical protein
MSDAIRESLWTGKGKTIDPEMEKLHPTTTVGEYQDAMKKSDELPLAYDEYLYRRVPTPFHMGARSDRDSKIDDYGLTHYDRERIKADEE